MEERQCYYHPRDQVVQDNDSKFYDSKFYTVEVEDPSIPNWYDDANIITKYFKNEIDADKWIEECTAKGCINIIKQENFCNHTHLEKMKRSLYDYTE